MERWMLESVTQGDANMDEGVQGEIVLDALATATTGTVASFACRSNRTIEWVDAAWETVTGIPADDALQRDLADLVAPASRVDVESAFHRALFAPPTVVDDPPVVRTPLPATGRVVDITLLPERDSRGVVGINGLVDDVTAVSDATSIASSLAPVFDRSPDLVGLTDDRGGILYMNPAARARFGIADPSRVTIDSMYPPVSVDLYYREVRPALLAKGWWRGIVTMRGRRETLLDVRQTVVAGLGDDDDIVWLLSVGEDITEARREHAELAYRATHDSLTGLANRTLLLDHLEHALARARRDGTTVAVIYADLDGFKAVNDTYGHAAGDRVLVEVGRRFGSVVRPSDTVARFGGDEFVVLCEGIDDGRGEVEEIAGRLRRALADEPLRVGATVVQLATTTGTAAAASGATTAAHLLAAADRSMYDARRSRRDSATDASRDYAD
jgi:diguanylate cyclase (GGDEF)-like protein